MGSAVLQRIHALCPGDLMHTCARPFELCAALLTHHRVYARACLRAHVCVCGTQVATDTRLWLHGQLQLIRAALHELINVACDRSAAEVDVLMPGPHAPRRCTGQTLQHGSNPTPARQQAMQGVITT